MPRFGAASPKEIIGKVAACTEVVAEVDLSGNALFKMKPGEYGASLASALSHNESVKSVKLRKLELGDADCAWLKTILETSKIAALDLEGNKISSAGAVLLAEGVAGNDALAALNLVGNGPFGESCMDAWLAALEKNVTLVDLKWRLDSRKSFKLRKGSYHLGEPAIEGVSHLVSRKQQSHRRQRSVFFATHRRWTRRTRAAASRAPR